jgi:hypothetical protein
MRGKEVAEAETELAIIQDEDWKLEEEAENRQAREVVRVETPAVCEDCEEMVRNKSDAEEDLETKMSLGLEGAVDLAANRDVLNNRKKPMSHS